MRWEGLSAWPARISWSIWAFEFVFLMVLKFNPILIRKVFDFVSVTSSEISSSVPLVSTWSYSYSILILELVMSNSMYKSSSKMSALIIRPLRCLEKLSSLEKTVSPSWSNIFFWKKLWKLKPKGKGEGRSEKQGRREDQDQNKSRYRYFSIFVA